MFGIQYRGFHVEDLPTSDIYRYKFGEIDNINLILIFRHLLVSVSYIHDVVSRGGTVFVNCFRGLSRSASCVLAYLIKYQNMTLDEVTCLDLSRT